MRRVDAKTPIENTENARSQQKKRKILVGAPFPELTCCALRALIDCRAMNDREFDIILFGATGFTGALGARYLSKVAPADSRLALAGRNRERLAAIADELERESGGSRKFELIHASLERPETLRAMAERTRVLITTVGPYRFYGEPVLRAAVEAGTDYIDITGEPAFVSEMIRKYHDRALEKKLRIVPCCGFDSIPHDLGAYFTVKQLPSGEAKEVDAFVRVRGSFSGGTWNSALNAFAEARSAITSGEASRKRGFADSSSSRIVENVSKAFRRGPYGAEWALVMPTIDPDIVLRSASMLPDYGPSFRYGHYLHHRSGLSAATTAIGAVGLVGLAQIGPIRQMIGKMRPAGAGPSEEERARSSFEVTFLGRSASGAQVETRFAGGDPGYDETSKMLSEAALCLAFDREELPERYGIVTTAAAMGDRLIERCRSAGLIIERVS